ncbi:MAG: ATP-binding protein [Chloroflexi bacterium]|nr:ATP-binding protein [Chloroflexota bacterium]MCL5273825.1 ATP-binding protein [Chloroflexota bacterium]
MTTPSESLSSPDAHIPPIDGGPDCRYCDNRRYVIDAQGRLKPCPECGVAQAWKVQAVDTFSSRGGAALKQTFFNFKTVFDGKKDDLLHDLLETAEAFAAQPDEHWLVLWGERGNGKSHLCAAVANHLIAAGTAALFITMPDLLAALRQAMDLQTNTEQESYTGRMQTFKTAPVLILDDLGAEGNSPWSDGVLFEILDYRYRNRLGTMIVTNCSLDAFDPRIASRMQDTALSIVIENNAQDYRKRPADKR